MKVVSVCTLDVILTIIKVHTYKHNCLFQNLAVVQAPECLKLQNVKSTWSPVHNNNPQPLPFRLLTHWVS